MAIQRALSKVARNRSEYFRLVHEIEGYVGREIDAKQLQAAVDAAYAGRDSLGEPEVYSLLHEVECRKHLDE